MTTPTPEELEAMFNYGTKRPIEKGEWYDQDAGHIDALLDASQLDEQDWTKELGI